MEITTQFLMVWGTFMIYQKLVKSGRKNLTYFIPVIMSTLIILRNISANLQGVTQHSLPMIAIGTIAGILILTAFLALPLFVINRLRK